MTANEIAQYLKIDLRSVFRKIDKAISRLADIALLKGWTSCFVSSQLEDEAWVIERFDDFYNDYKNKVAKLQGNKQAD